jgi:hypothetical protein
VALHLAALTLLASSAWAADHAAALQEADSLLMTEAQDSGRSPYTPDAAVKFNPADHVYVKSALAIDLTYGNATVTLPTFKGFSPNGAPVDFIITESSDYDVAQKMGINYAPKLALAVGSAGVQKVTLENGHMKFVGSVDFDRPYQVVRGDVHPFPPKVAVPGAVADAAWSSIVVLPSGVVLNAQVVHNASGNHLRLKNFDNKAMTVTLSVLDGFQGGKEYFYHLVTDASADVPAVIEKGVYAPTLAKLPTFGKSGPHEGSALLGFAPVANGITDVKTGQAQGFAMSLANGGLDPINVFPFAPDNENRSADNNYSPLWDAHVVVWTEKAFKDKKVRQIKSFEDLETLTKADLITSANLGGEGNPFLFGLHPLNVIINCPVIAHPEHVTR